MPRTREFDPEFVLDTAIELFWEKGFSDSSVDEVVRRSKVAKYGIYGTFSSKKKLFMRALEKYAKSRHLDIQKPIRQPDASLPEVKLFFKRAVKMMCQSDTRPGCLIVNTGVELGSRDEEIKEFVESFFHETKLVMASCLKRAVESGQLKSETDIESLAMFLVNEFRNALMLASSGCNSIAIRKHLDMALKIAI